MNAIEAVKQELEANKGKLSFNFIKLQVNDVNHRQLTPNMRVCIIRTVHGHEVIGVAQVLDSKNDVQELGEQVAYGMQTRMYAK